VAFVLVQAAICLLISEAIIRFAAGFSRTVRSFMNYSYGEWQNWRKYEKAGTLKDLLEVAPNPRWEPLEKYCGYILNSRGLRTPEYDAAKKPGSRRIVLIGDSFLILPSGPDDRFNISNCLRRETWRDGHPVETINLGVECTGPRFYLRMMELEGSRLGADCILVFLYAGNDLTDEPMQPEPAGISQSMLKHLYTYRLFRTCRILLTGITMTSLPPDFPPLIPAKHGKGGYFEGGGPGTSEVSASTEKAWIDMQIGHTGIYAEPWGPGLLMQWRAMTGVLQRMKQVADDRHAPLLLVIIPDATQTIDSLQVLARSKFPGIRLDFDKPQRELKACCRNYGIAVVDLLPAFRKASRQGKTLYRVNDAHWNNYGQVLAARIIAPYVSRTADWHP